MLADLIEACGYTTSEPLARPLDLVATPFDPRPFDGAGRVPRHVIAHALGVALFVDLIARVPSGAEYVCVQFSAGRQIVLDHGAVRTVAWPTNSRLPAGIEQVSRILEPLGYSRRANYPLTRLRMTGHSYAHDDMSDDLGQWFVSEFHPDEFSGEFQRAVERVIETSVDPVDTHTDSLLARLSIDRELPTSDALDLMPALYRCFRRLHQAPLDSDYDLLRTESAEMAWIATEGTAFNHATDRVADVEVTADRERAAGRPIKDRVEVSGSGRVRQTAHLATTVERTLRTAEGSSVTRQVPGSFFEFIDRRVLPDSAAIDLAFDASNAQGIFKMTATPDAGDTSNGPER